MWSRAHVVARTAARRATATGGITCRSTSLPTVGGVARMCTAPKPPPKASTFFSHAVPVISALAALGSAYYARMTVDQQTKRHEEPRETFQEPRHEEERRRYEEERKRDEEERKRDEEERREERRRYEEERKRCVEQLAPRWRNAIQDALDARRGFVQGEQPYELATEKLDAAIESVEELIDMRERKQWAAFDMDVMTDTVRLLQREKPWRSHSWTQDMVVACDKTPIHKLYHLNAVLHYHRGTVDMLTEDYASAKKRFQRAAKLLAIDGKLGKEHRVRRRVDGAQAKVQHRVSDKVGKFSRCLPQSDLVEQHKGGFVAKQEAMRRVLETLQAPLQSAAGCLPYDVFHARATSHLAMLLFAHFSNGKEVVMPLMDVCVKTCDALMLPLARSQVTEELATALKVVSANADELNDGRAQLLQPVLAVGENMVVDVGFLPYSRGGDLVTTRRYRVEALERTKIVWRKALSARGNQLWIMTHSWQKVFTAADVVRVLQSLATDEGVATMLPLYKHLDKEYWEREGRGRVLVSIAGALELLLRHNVCKGDVELSKRLRDCAMQCLDSSGFLLFSHPRGSIVATSCYADARLIQVLLNHDSTSYRLSSTSERLLADAMSALRETEDTNPHTFREQLWALLVQQHVTRSSKQLRDWMDANKLQARLDLVSLCEDTGLRVSHRALTMGLRGGDPVSLATLLNHVERFVQEVVRDT